MKRIELYSTLKLIGLCFVGLLLFDFGFLHSIPHNWVWAILLALYLGVQAVLIEKWRGPYY